MSDSEPAASYRFQSAQTADWTDAALEERGGRSTYAPRARPVEPFEPSETWDAQNVVDSGSDAAGLDWRARGHDRIFRHVSTVVVTRNTRNLTRSRECRSYPRRRAMEQCSPVGGYVRAKRHERFVGSLKAQPKD